MNLLIDLLFNTMFGGLKNRRGLWMQKRMVAFLILLLFIFVLFVGYTFVRGFLVMTGHIQFKPVDLLHRNGFDWHTTETEHFYIHYEAESYAEKKLKKLKQINESAFVGNLHILGEYTYPEKLNIFAVESR